MWLTWVITTTQAMSVETKGEDYKTQESKSSQNIARDVGCSQSAVSKIWTKNKQNGKVVKGKHTGRPEKTSTCQDRKLKTICLENRKCTTRQMRNKSGVSFCDRTIRNRWRQMGFTYRKDKWKPSLTPPQRKQGYSWLKKSSHGLWVTESEYYPRSVLGRMMMLEL